MIVTVLEARIPSDRVDELQEGFNELLGKGLPPAIVESDLVQKDEDPAIWQLVTLWQSREALFEYRRTQPVPEGLLLFRSVDVEPSVTFFDVVDGTVH